jgi:hypothetical protein
VREQEQNCSSDWSRGNVRRKIAAQNTWLGVSCVTATNSGRPLPRFSVGSLKRTPTPRRMHGLKTRLPVWNAGKYLIGKRGVSLTTVIWAAAAYEDRHISHLKSISFCEVFSNAFRRDLRKPTFYKSLRILDLMKMEI